MRFTGQQHSPLGLPHHHQQPQQINQQLNVSHTTAKWHIPQSAQQANGISKDSQIFRTYRRFVMICL